MLDTIKKYYVYVYLDPRRVINKEYEGVFFKYEPFYIGKGHGDRLNEHLKEVRKTNILITEGKINKKDVHRKIHKINNIHRSGLKPIIKKIFKDIDEEEAYVTENILIEEIGRIEDGGCLFNYRTGGYEGGSLGEESKQRIRESLEKYFKANGLWNYEKNCRIPWNINVPMPEEQKQYYRELYTGIKQPKEIIDKRATSNRKNWLENKEERWGKMKNTMDENGYVRDNKSIGKKISESKKGNVIITEKQRNQISNTLKRKYETGEIKVWNTGLKGVQKSVRRKKVAQLDLSGEIVEIHDSVTIAGNIGNSNSVRDHIKRRSIYKGYKWLYYEDYLKLKEVHND